MISKASANLMLAQSLLETSIYISCVFSNLLDVWFYRLLCCWFWLANHNFHPWQLTQLTPLQAPPGVAWRYTNWPSMQPICFNLRTLVYKTSPNKKTQAHQALFNTFQYMWCPWSFGYVPKISETYWNKLKHILITRIPEFWAACLWHQRLPQEPRAQPKHCARWLSHN